MELMKICNMQKEYFLSGETLSISFRKKQLQKLYDVTSKYEDEIVNALKEDLGKSKEESYMSEIGMVKTEITHMLKHITSYSKKKYVSTPLTQFLSFSYKKSIPYGTTLIMSPWNYPFLLTLDPLVCAIAAGDTAVLKPGPASIHTNAIMKKMIEEIYDEKYITLIEGGIDVASNLLDQDFDFVFFTGGTATGQIIYQKCAEKMIPCVLELGGKSPCIVDETADISLSAKRIVFGKYLNCGQTCVAPDYILVHQSVKDKLIQELIKQIHKQYSNTPLQSPIYGKIIHEGQYNRVLGLLDTSKVIYGGSSNKETLQIEPTIMDHVTWNDKVMQEEIFGPILPVLTYENFDEMLNELKRKPHPLAFYLFTKNKNHISKVDNEMIFGGGCINDTIIHLASTELGFGGVGASGIGKYHGKDGFDAFSHTKSIVDKKCCIDLPMRYAPYNNNLYNKLIRFFMK